MSNILVIGDVIHDEYVTVTSSRRAQEAPVAVWDVVKTEARPGGAANVALNAAMLCNKYDSVFMCGAGSEHVRSGLEDRGVDCRFYLCTDDYPKKVRYVTRELPWKILARVDSGYYRDDIESWCSELLFSAGIKFDVVVISDYNRGTLTSHKFVDNVIKRWGPSIVDSKRQDLGIFVGADILKLNREEYMALPSLPLSEWFSYVVVTKGKDGADLILREELPRDGSQYGSAVSSRYAMHVEMFRGEPANEVDVTGCGDTHTAAMAVSLVERPNDVRAAVAMGNRAAAIAVQKQGTSGVSRWELERS